MTSSPKRAISPKCRPEKKISDFTDDFFRTINTQSPPIINNAPSMKSLVVSLRATPMNTSVPVTASSSAVRKSSMAKLTCLRG